MPKEPPSVVIVSEIPAAAPALSGGAAVITLPMLKVTAMPQPVEISNEAISITVRSVLMRVNTVSPAPIVSKARMISRGLGISLLSGSAKEQEKVLMIAAGNVHSPAASGVILNANCKYCPTNRNMPHHINNAMQVVTNAIRNNGILNKLRLINGSGSFCCLRKKIIQNTQPISTGSSIIGSRLFSASSLMPYVTGSIVTSNKITLAKSNFAVPGSLNSGSSNGPTIKNRSITGTLIKKTEPHQKWFSRKPPTTGPSIVPVEKQVVHKPTAKLRWLSL